MDVTHYTIKLTLGSRSPADLRDRDALRVFYAVLSCAALRLTATLVTVTLPWFGQAVYMCLLRVCVAVLLSVGFCFLCACTKKHSHHGVFIRAIWHSLRKILFHVTFS